MPGQVRILCLDGGGVFGIVPARVLAEIEKRTGKPIKDMFHMVAGTSTGGIIGASMVQEHKTVTAEDMVDLYLERGPDIFAKTLMSQIRSVYGWIKAKYSNEVLKQELHDRMGDVKLSDITETDLLITAADVEKMEPYVFHSWKARGQFVDLDDGESASSQDYYLRDVALATASAPVLFPPAEITNFAGHDKYFVDGGMFATNPTMLALAEAQRLYPRADSYLVISLGTGDDLQGIDVKKTKNWGLLGWSDKHIDMFLGLRDRMTEFQSHKFLHPRHSENEYFRLSPTMDDMMNSGLGITKSLDDASPENLAKVLSLADELIETRDKDIDKICAFLKKEMDPRAGLQKSVLAEPLRPKHVMRLCSEDACGDEPLEDQGSRKPQNKSKKVIPAKGRPKIVKGPRKRKKGLFWGPR